MDRLARRLRAARDPVLILGDGVRWRLDLAPVRGLLERLSLPVVSFALVRGVLGESHPFAVCGAVSRARVLAQADLVVLFGADPDWRLRFGAEINPGASVILVSDTTELPPTLAERGERMAADPGLLLNRLAHAPWRVRPPRRPCPRPVSPLLMHGLPANHPLPKLPVSRSGRCSR
ncbi:MAG: hypothetical protein WBN89_10730 [Prochlorococcaceae cyanobacterium]